ncbi:MAG TPA: phosphate ABC transporter ATP-binding protein [bacterium]|nr:phosphate ABC transporter ATP-binding protein [bacterium]
MSPPGILPLRLEGVSFAIDGQRLLHDLSFELRAGQRTVLMGPNGAGKSLTLRLCHGLLKPSAGTVRWLGPEGVHARDRQAMVFQRPVLLRRTALANVAYALGLKGVPRRERRAMAMHALEQSGLAALAQRQARVLSGGEQQRLTLARAWALRPEVLFLDEPTANLDPAATRAVESVIQAIQAAGTKIVMTTHDLGQARRLADEVLFLHHGRLLEQAPADRFFTAPGSAEARAFLRGELLW